MSLCRVNLSVAFVKTTFVSLVSQKNTFKEHTRQTKFFFSFLYFLRGGGGGRDPLNKKFARISRFYQGVQSKIVFFKGISFLMLFPC